MASRTWLGGLRRWITRVLRFAVRTVSAGRQNKRLRGALRSKGRQVSELRAALQKEQRQVAALRSETLALRAAQVSGDKPGVLGVLGDKTSVGDSDLVSAPSPAERESWLALYQRTLSLFDEARPGFGLDPGSPETPLHHPMAYACYASAESGRFLSTRDHEAHENAVRAARWLVENQSLAGNGDVGWGLPWSWAAFHKEVANPPHTVYAITTALGMKALMDAADTCRVGRLRKETELYADLVDTAWGAARTFIDGCFDYDERSDELVFWYSHVPDDAYHVPNVSSMLVGQLQRLSRYVESQVDREALRTTADRGARYILGAAAVDANGNTFWHYFGGKRPKSATPPPNDLVHECYTILGLAEYAAHSGRLADRVDFVRLLLSLGRFLDLYGGMIHEFPRTWDPGARKAGLLQQPARLWGAGYILYATAYLERASSLGRSVSAQCLDGARRYWDGRRWCFMPGVDLPFYPRHAAHVLAGLSEWLYPRENRSAERADRGGLLKPP